MKFRKLRIAWSVFCGIAGVLLVVLWVRSYTSNDAFCGPLWGHDETPHATINYAELKEIKDSSIMSGLRKTSISVESRKGELGGSILLDDDDVERFWFTTSDYPEDSNLDSFADPRNCNWLGFHYVIEPGFALDLVLPFWFLVLATASMAAVPWIRWSNRFSLRTLLIATTLVAVVLGTIVWFSR